MKLIVAGSRHFDQAEPVKKYITSAVRDLESITESKVTEIVSGTARGIDTIGEEWARENGIPVKRFPADWDTYGKRAGHIRNREMAEYADAALVIWDGKSRGSANMVATAEAMTLTLMQVQIEIQPDYHRRDNTIAIGTTL
jgi:hypothetical protein